MRIYLRILAYGQESWGKGLLALGFLLLFNIFNAVSLAMVIPFLDILFSPLPENVVKPEGFSSAHLSEIKATAFNYLNYYLSYYGKAEVLIWFCVVLVISIFFKSLFRYLSSYLIAPLEQGIVMRMREQVFAHLTRLSMQFYTRKRKGELISVVVSDVQVVQESVVGNIQTVLRDPLTMVVFLGVMLTLSWKLTLFTLLVLPLTGLVITSVSKSLKRKANKGQERLDALISVLDEFIGGMRIVKAFNAEDFERAKYQKQNLAYFQTQVSISRRSDFASPATEVISIGVVAIIILYGGNLILSGNSELKPSEFIGFIAIFSQFLAPIKTFSHAIARVNKGVASFQRIWKLLQEPITVPEKLGAIPLDKFEKNIVFDKVCFKYEDKEILKNINLTLNKGEMIALVGPSGAGKSTLADLLPRFYDPYSGAIFIDGKNLRDLQLSSVRNKMGIVSQEGILFNDSVYKNIAYGDRQQSIESVIEAAKIANADEFIKALPQGYYTTLGERGTRLSGGQRQRIAIARAILKNPDILILDEATSALDTESEKYVQEALEKLMENRTSLVIAHRLSTILKADRILVMEGGEILESGTHTELLALDGLYRRLFDIQFK